MGRKILVVEDNPDISHLLALHLKDMGCEVTTSDDGGDALQRVAKQSFDLIILDLMLPGVEGLEVCRRIHAQADYTPILMLTAKSSEMDRVVGLEMGADDYLTKPFSIHELLARVKALFRRVEALSGGGKPADETLHLGRLIIDADRRQVRIDDNLVDLTAKEFDLLLQFARNPGRVYSRAQLLDLVWGYGHDGYEHTVNSHINRLRAKIEADPAHPDLILTVWGVGYKFNDTP